MRFTLKSINSWPTVQIISSKLCSFFGEIHFVGVEWVHNIVMDDSALCPYVREKKNNYVDFLFKLGIIGNHDITTWRWQRILMMQGSYTLMNHHINNKKKIPPISIFEPTKRSGLYNLECPPDQIQLSSDRWTDNSN